MGSPSSVKYPGGGVSEEFGAGGPPEVGCGDERCEDDEDGAEVGNGALSGTLLARSSREGISGGSSGGSCNERLETNFKLFP